MRARERRWQPYAVAAALTLACMLLRIALAPWVGSRPFLLIFFLPIIVAAYSGGLRPGLLATALTAVATMYVALPPLYHFGFGSPLDFAHWLFMLLEGVLISVLFSERAGWRTAEPLESIDHKHAATERKVRLGFAVAIAFLGTIGIVSYLSVVRFDENSQLVTRSHSVMSNIDALVSTTFESESAQRAYIISGEEPFAADYTRAIGRVNGLLQELRDAVHDSPDQLARVDNLAKAVRERMRHSDEIIELRRTGGIEAVQRRLAESSARPGATLQVEMRRLAQEMKNDEILQLNERELEAQRSARKTKAVIVGGSALAVVFVGIALLVIRRDFAGRARAETELNRFFDLSIDIFTISSADGYFKRLSPAVTDVLGYTIEEALRIPYMDLVHPDDRARAHDVVRRQVDKGERIDAFTGRMLHKNGSWRTLSWRSLPRGNLMFATARDVTDEVRAQQELRDAKERLEERVAERTRALEEAYDSLRKSERQFRALIENSADCISLTGSDRIFRYVSPSVTRVEGYSPEELLGTLATDQTHPDDLEPLAKAMEQLFLSPGKPIPAVWRRRHKDGHWIWLEGVATNLLDDPSVGAIVCNYRDITDRLAHERRLGEQLKRLALLSRITRAIGERQDLRSIFQAVVHNIEDELPVDLCCICLYDSPANRLSVSCVGTKSEPLLRELGLQQATQLPVDENGLSRAMHGQLVYEPDIGVTNFQFPRRLAATGLRSLVIAPLLVESRVFGALICARRDVDAFSSGECEFLQQASEHTALAAHQSQLYSALQQAYDDLRQTQQQVMQQERLRALGQMASGIAHDINNAISPMALYTEALLDHETGLSERGRKQLEIIQRAVDDVAQTVARMGEFYRLREPEAALTPVDLNLLVEQVVDLTRARWSDMAQQRGAAIELRLEQDPALPTIAGVQSQIRDALVNLVFNAVDAMPQGGPLILRTRVASDGAAIVDVIDSGVGMDEETRRRCLEPFFSTKGARGTGLGLPMVYGVAQRHGAQLEIDSAPGQGTTVRLAFAPAAPLSAPVAETRIAKVPRLRILIVDDDPLLLNSLRDALESEGHEIVTANGGQAGINAFVEAHADGQPFPVVITDLGMPHIDGRRVASTVKASVPDTVVLMLTGWGRRMVTEGDLPPSVDAILSKPPKLAELRAALAAHVSRG
ncbi:MAG TPA: PAS domain S-box protein [Steroidobacteraceae bacterium]|nr:PAS domain S-box protein [Steroidobacteraceae bacterium]